MILDLALVLRKVRFYNRAFRHTPPSWGGHPKHGMGATVGTLIPCLMTYVTTAPVSQLITLIPRGCQEQL